MQKLTLDKLASGSHDGIGYGKHLCHRLLQVHNSIPINVYYHTLAAFPKATSQVCNDYLFSTD